MKNIRNILLLFAALLSANVLMAQVSAQQKIGGTNESGYWTFGINAGLSYQSSDVRAITGGYGFGLTLAKNLYQRTGAPIVFDLRGRFLYARNYGLDAERSYQIDKNQVLNGAQGLDYTNYPADLNISRGFVYQNHQTEIGELSLEAVLTLNRLREKTGIIASVYGGLGVDWYRTKIDQANGSGQPYYQAYANLDENQRNSLIRKELQNNILDGNYETLADGFDNKSGKLGIMPSLGIELGYQFTPRFSMHLGHRLTFSGTDILDGQQWADENKDIYHYTNFALRWKIEPRRSIAQAPEIDLISPARSPHNMGAANGTVRANIRHISSAMDVSCVLNGRTQPFDYHNGLFSSNVLLQPGSNEMIITASNEAGTDRETLIIYYEDQVIVTPPVVDRRLPNVTITNPSRSEASSASRSFTLQASIQEVNSQNDIEFLFNGRALRNFTFDSRTGKLRADLQLERGRNSVRITARNLAGTSQAEAFITYEEQAAPYVNITDPNRERVETDLPTVRIVAEVANVDRKDQIQVRLNGRAISSFDYIASQNQLVVNIRLERGSNQLEITAQNSSGQASDEVFINFRESVAFPPRVTITNPSNTNSNSNSTNVRIEARIEGVNSARDIDFYLNGRSETNFRFTPSTGRLDHNVNLDNGNNTVRIVARNQDGQDEASVSIRYAPAKLPQVSITSPGNNTTTQNASINLRARTEEIRAKSEISLYLNGRSISNFSFNSGNQEITAALTLTEGNNNIKITVQNDNGRSEDQVSVRYNKASNPPSVTIIQPSNNGTVSNERIVLKASTRNVTRSSDVEVFVNGQRFTNFTFNANRQEVTGTLTLATGNNSIRVRVQNDDGNAEDEVNVRYLKPVSLPTVNITAPSNNSTQDQAQVSLKATTKNIVNKNGITVYLNNRVVSNFTFNSLRQEITANLPLEAGNNSIRIEVKNPDGNGDDAVNVRYNPAKKPEVTISTPSPDQSTTDQNTQQLTATVRNVDGKQQIAVSLNGTKWSNFDFNTQSGQLTARLTLKTGTNRIVVSATNSSGTAEDSKVVTYKVAQLPKVTINSPANNAQLTKEPVLVTATIVNMATSKDVTFKLDNKVVTGFTYNKGQFKASLTQLSRGQHTISIAAKNADGQDESSIRFNYAPPILSAKPTVTFVNPAKTGKTVTEAKQKIVVKIENVSSQKQIKLLVNRKLWTAFNFDGKAQELTATINLGKGTTSIRVEATNEGGSANAETTMIYEPSNKRPPIVTIESVSQPVTNPLNPGVGRSTVIATIKNISGARQLTFKVNNERITNFTFDVKSGRFESTVDLVRGENTVSIEATNADGKDTKTQSVNF